MSEEPIPEKSGEEIFDIIVIGAGPGGYHSALRAAQYDAKVAIIEKEYLGGTCSNWGCIPTKALYTSATMLEEIREKSSILGIEIDGYRGNFKKAVERKNQVVKELREGIKGLLTMRKVKIFWGFGKIEGGNNEEGFLVSIAKDGNKQIIKGKRIIVATGSTPALIPAFNIDHKKIITSDDILAENFNELPKSLLVIGAGVIGCEFANIFAQYGTKVIMLEFLPTMLATEEKIIIKEMQKKFEKMGIEVNTNVNVLKVEATETGVKATTVDASIPKDKIDSAEKKTFEAELCLVSIGRAKIYNGIGLEELGARIEKRAIWVNPRTMETSVPGIYSIGDVNQVGLMLAHVASYEGDIAVANALASIGGFPVHRRQATNQVVPYTIFTSPEIGTVGMRESDAKELAKARNQKVYTGRFYYNALGKAKCMAAEEGFMQITADAATDQILGATCVGMAAPELIAEIALAMQYGITAEEVAEVVHSHPTISEMVLETAEDVHGKAIHKVGRVRHGNE